MREQHRLVAASGPRRLFEQRRAQREDGLPGALTGAAGSRKNGDPTLRDPWILAFAPGTPGAPDEARGYSAERHEGVDHLPEFVYTCFDLTIGSELECPELLPSEGMPDVWIRRGQVGEHLEGASRESVLFETAPEQFLLKVRNVARYLVRDGAEIVVDPAPDCGAGTVRLFLLGSAMGALLVQRGLLPLHASAIATRRGAVALAGPSGSGKSVLAAVFRRRGYRVLADDLLAVSLAGEPLVLPGSPNLMLWADALGHLGIDGTSLRAVRPDLQKYLLPLHERFSTAPLRLHKIFSLARAAKLGLEPIEGREKVRTLAGHAYRRLFATGMKLSAEHSERVRAVAGPTPMVRAFWPDATRPEIVWRLEEFADLLAEDLEA